MRPVEWLLIVLCTLTLGLQLHDAAARANRLNCRTPAVRANPNTNGRWVF